MNRNFLFSILTIIIFLGHTYLHAQNSVLSKSDETDLITYSKIIDLPGVVQNEFYHKAFVWCNEFYKNPKNVIKKKDVLNGLIECKGRFRIVNPAKKRQIETAAGIVQYTLTINVEDDKYRYTVTKINWKQTSYYPIERWMSTEKDSYKPVYAEYLKQVDEEIKQLIASLTAAMAKPAEVKSSDVN